MTDTAHSRNRSRNSWSRGKCLNIREGALDGLDTFFVDCWSPHHPDSTATECDSRNLKAGLTEYRLLLSDTSRQLQSFSGARFSAYSGNPFDNPTEVGVLGRKDLANPKFEQQSA